MHIFHFFRFFFTSSHEATIIELCLILCLNSILIQAEEIQRQRILLMEGKLLKCPKELRNHPVLIMNESTNNFVIKRRAKVRMKKNVQELDENFSTTSLVII